jgi:hypothetical protein
MTDARPQSYSRHRKFVPGYHFVTLPLLLVLLVWAVVLLIANPDGASLFRLLLVIAVASIAVFARTFPLKAQDRLIRLETRLRLAGILPADLAARVPELSTGQLIALRFAADEELPDLVRRCLAGELTGREQIKREIRTWVPDHARM